ncbi:MAG: hypothetical protein ACI8ZF_000882 [Candidatus Midichloriaceae bacterium]
MIGLAFSPLGPIAIAIAVTVSVSCMVYGVINEGKILKDLKVQQNEGKAVEELMEMRGEQLEILANNPKLAAVLMKDIKSPEKKIGFDKTVEIKNAMEGMPETLVPFLGNLMSGNPVFIAVGTFTFATNTFYNISEEVLFSKQRDQMMDITKENQNLLGIEFPIGKGGNFLKDQLLENKAKLHALEKMKDTNESDPEKTREEFDKIKEKYKAEHKDDYKEKYEVKGDVLAHTKEAFQQSFSYEKSREMLAPMAYHNEDKNSTLTIDIQQKQNAIIQQQRMKEEGIGNNKKNVEKKSTFVEKLKSKSDYIEKTI